MRKEIILEIAYNKFAERGYNITLTEIAESAGIKKQSLYNYFNSKDELFHEMIVNRLDIFFLVKKKELDELSDLRPDERLKALFFLVVIGLSEDITSLRFWRWLLLIESKDLLKKTNIIIDEHEKRFVVYLEALIFQVFEEKSSEERNKILQTYIALLHGILDSFLFQYSSYDIQSLTENIWETFWNGLSCCMKEL